MLNLIICHGDEIGNLKERREKTFLMLTCSRFPPASGYLEDVHYFLWHKKALDKMSMTNR
jgi:hypothetical protein